MSPVLAFDVYGTLFDVSSVENEVREIAGEWSGWVACQEQVDGDSSWGLMAGRGERIRTSDSCVPNAVYIPVFMRFS